MKSVLSQHMTSVKGMSQFLADDQYKPKLKVGTLGGVKVSFKVDGKRVETTRTELVKKLVSLIKNEMHNASPDQIEELKRNFIDIKEGLEDWSGFADAKVKEKIGNDKFSKIKKSIRSIANFFKNIIYNREKELKKMHSKLMPEDIELPRSTTSEREGLRSRSQSHRSSQSSSLY